MSYRFFSLILLLIVVTTFALVAPKYHSQVVDKYPQKPAVVGPVGSYQLQPVSPYRPGKTTAYGLPIGPQDGYEWARQRGLNCAVDYQNATVYFREREDGKCYTADIFK